MNAYSKYLQGFNALQGSNAMKHLELKITRSLQFWLIIAATVTLQSLTLTASAQSVETRPALRQGVTEAMTVPLFKSGVLRLDEAAARISVGNPDIADILILRSTQLYVLGKDIGTTNVILWDRNDQLIGTVEVEVTHDLTSLKGKLHQLLPNDEITVYSSQRDIVLSGQVSNISSMEAALRIAEGYLTSAGTAVDDIQFEESGEGNGIEGTVVNLMQIGGGQQVMLEV